MEDEPKGLQASEPQPSPAYPQDRFVLLLIILVLLIASISAAQRIPFPDAGPRAFSEDLLQGDVAVKFSYAYERWVLSVPVTGEQRRQMEALRERQRETAIAWYQRAARENPSRDTMRRLITIQYPRDQSWEIERLAEIGERRGRDFPEDEELRDEVAMWRSIYVSDDRLAPGQVEAYMARIRSLDLGWYEHLALADLYKRAGMTARAEDERAEAAREASRTIAMLLGLMFVVGLLGVAGVALIAWYVTARKAGRLVVPEEEMEQPPDVRNRVACCLLETFVVYLAVAVGTQVAVAVAMAVGVFALGAPRPESAILVTAGVYTLAGVLATLYLTYRLRSVGWSRKAVGLATRNPLLDIAWGIGGYAAALPLILIASLLSRVLSRYVQTPSNPIVPLFAEARDLLGQLILLALVVIAAPFFEELFFRGVLFNSFRAKWGVRVGIVLSAAVFAAVHPLPLGFLPIFVLGYIFATLVHQRGSVLPAMVAHGLNNGVAFTALLILLGP